MQTIPITELGIGIAAVLAIVLIVRAFLKHLSDKDELFTTTINNHLHDDAEAKVKLAASHDNLTRVIDKMLEKG